MAIAKLLHLLAALIWVGGMFFAFMVLRPVAGSMLEPPVRQTLWLHVFKRFFPWVWLSILILLGTGIGMIVLMGGMAEVGTYVHIMLTLGIIMMLIFLHIFFAPFRRMRLAVADNNWEEGGRRLNQIRLFIQINLIIGISMITATVLGKYNFIAALN